MKKIAVIRKCKEGDAKEGKPWCLYDHKGEKLLGRHPSKESARKQESAIKAQASLYKVCNYLGKIADKEHPRNWQQFEEEYGESKQEHMQDPNEDRYFIEAIHEDLLENPVDVFMEYVSDYYSQGVITDKDILELGNIPTNMLGEPIRFSSLEDLGAFIVQYQGDDVESELKNELAADIAERIVKDRRFQNEKESWASHLKEKFMSPEELYGFR
jgi:hypothetical protein